MKSIGQVLNRIAWSTFFTAQSSKRNKGKNLHANKKKSGPGTSLEQRVFFLFFKKKYLPPLINKQKEKDNPFTPQEEEKNKDYCKPRFCNEFAKCPITNCELPPLSSMEGEITFQISFSTSTNKSKLAELTKKRCKTRHKRGPPLSIIVGSITKQTNDEP